MWLKITSAPYFYLYAWIVLISVVSAFVFKVTLHSDLLFFDALTEDIFHYGGSFVDWKFPAAPAIFPDVLLYWASYFLFDSAVFRVAFVCIMQAVMLASACVYLGSVIRPMLSDSAKSLIVLSVAIVTLVSLKSNMWLFFNSTNNHIASLLCSLIGLAMLIQFARHKKYYYLIGVAVVTFLASVSTSLIALTFTIPIIVLAVIWALFFGLIGLKQVWPPVLAVLLGSSASAVVSAIFSPLSAAATKERLSLSVDRIAHAISMFREAFKLSFSPDNLYTLFLSIFFIVVFIWVLVAALAQVKIQKFDKSNSISVGFKNFNENRWIIGLSFYWCVASIVTVLGSLVTAGFADPWGFRYFSLPICIGVLIWILLLDTKGVLGRSYFKATISFIAVLCILVTGQTWLSFIKTNHVERQDALFYGRSIYTAEVACLKEIEDSGFLFESGLGDYWSARGLRYRFNNEKFILPITNDGSVFFHMMGLGPLETPIKYGAGRYNFAILNKSNTQTQFNLTPETVGKLLPAPSAIHSCKNSTYEVWTYSDETLDRFVKKNINQLLIGLHRNGSFLEMDASTLPGVIGKIKDHARVANQGVDSTGFLTYGPYMRLPKGHYVLSIDYEASADGSKWDYGVFGIPNSPPISLGEGLLPRSASGQVEHSFILDKDIGHFEIRTWYGGFGRLVINKVQIRQAP
jgi:hypothetical protein